MVLAQHHQMDMVSVKELGGGQLIRFDSAEDSPKSKGEYMD